MPNRSPKSPDPERAVALDPCQLREGLYIRLSLGWMDHPFLFNEFRITRAEQIATLQELGLTAIDYLPSRSTAAPLPLPHTSVPAPLPAGPTPEQLAAAEDKRRRAERVAEQRGRLARSERRYTKAAGEIREVMRNLFAASDRSVSAARELVAGLVESFADEADSVIHLMNEKLADENTYFHSLNVMILSLLLGRSAGCTRDEMRQLGEGALFHDIGKSRVPDAVQRNPARNRHEEEFYRLHPEYGVEMARAIGMLSPAAIDIIWAHHETMDGKGYPRGLKGARIPRLARIVAIADRYDELCNPLLADQALTPAEAVTTMFKREAALWDPELLQRFIRVLGIYPPGSVVLLSNGAIGIVVAVDRADLLRPSVLIYDPAVPKSEAIIVDLIAEPDLKVESVLRPASLTPDVLRYLAPRRRLSYFHGDKASDQG